MDGRRRQRLLRGHPHAAQDADDHGQDEEDAARHVDEDVGVVVLPLGAHCWSRRRRRNGEEVINT